MGGKDGDTAGFNITTHNTIPVRSLESQNVALRAENLSLREENQRLNARLMVNAGNLNVHGVGAYGVGTDLAVRAEGKLLVEQLGAKNVLIQQQQHEILSQRGNLEMMGPMGVGDCNLDHEDFEKYENLFRSRMAEEVIQVVHKVENEVAKYKDEIVHSRKREKQARHDLKQLKKKFDNYEKIQKGEIVNWEKKKKSDLDAQYLFYYETYKAETETKQKELNAKLQEKERIISQFPHELEQLRVVLLDIDMERMNTEKRKWADKVGKEVDGQIKDLKDKYKTKYKKQLKEEVQKVKNQKETKKSFKQKAIDLEKENNALKSSYNQNFEVEVNKVSGDFKLKHEREIEEMEFVKSEFNKQKKELTEYHHSYKESMNSQYDNLEEEKKKSLNSIKEINALNQHKMMLEEKLKIENDKYILEAQSKDQQYHNQNKLLSDNKNDNEKMVTSSRIHTDTIERLRNQTRVLDVENNTLKHELDNFKSHNREQMSHEEDLSRKNTQLNQQFADLSARYNSLQNRPQNSMGDEERDHQFYLLTCENERLRRDLERVNYEHQALLHGMGVARSRSPQERGSMEGQGRRVSQASRDVSRSNERIVTYQNPLEIGIVLHGKKTG